MTPSNRSRQEKPGAQLLSSSDFAMNPGLKITGLPASVGNGGRGSSTGPPPIACCAAAGSAQTAAATNAATEHQQNFPAKRRLMTLSPRRPGGEGRVRGAEEPVAAPPTPPARSAGPPLSPLYAAQG